MVNKLPVDHLSDLTASLVPSVPTQGSLMKELPVTTCLRKSTQVCQLT